MFAVQKVAKKGWLNTDLILTVQRFWVDDAAFVNKWRSVFLQTDAFVLLYFFLKERKINKHNSKAVNFSYFCRGICTKCN